MLLYPAKSYNLPLYALNIRPEMESLIIGVAAGVIASGIILLVEMLIRRRERKREIADQRLHTTSAGQIGQLQAYIF